MQSAFPISTQCFLPFLKTISSSVSHLMSSVFAICTEGSNYSYCCFESKKSWAFFESHMFGDRPRPRVRYQTDIPARATSKVICTEIVLDRVFITRPWYSSQGYFDSHLFEDLPRPSVHYHTLIFKSKLLRYSFVRRSSSTECLLPYLDIPAKATSIDICSKNFLDRAFITIPLYSNQSYLDTHLFGDLPRPNVHYHTLGYFVVVHKFEDRPRPSVHYNTLIFKSELIRYSFVRRSSSTECSL